jgi:hypothetical protein
LTIAATADAGWTYLNPGFDYFGFRDRNGVLHSFQADQARYNRARNDYQVLIRGRWLFVGRDIYQLTDVPIPINLEHGQEKRWWRFT